MFASVDCVRDLGVMIDSKLKFDKCASCPDWHISLHADPITANSLQHWPSPSKWRHVAHTTHGPRLSSQVCRIGLTTVEHVIDFSIFELGGLPMGQSSPKGEMTWWTPRSTTLQNFITLRQLTPDMSVTKILRTDRTTDGQTVNDIFPASLSACGDNILLELYTKPCLEQTLSSYPFTLVTEAY